MRRIAVVVPLIVLLAGCGGGGDSAGDSNTTAMARPAGGADSAGGADKAGRPAADQQLQQAVSKPVAVPRSLIRTASLDVRVRDVKKAAAAAEKVVEDAGGDLSAEDLDLRSSHPTARLELQVPPARLAATLTRLSALGDEQSRRLGTDDVTDQVIDLDSRLATQRASVTRVRALLDRARTLSDVVRVEAELSRREADLESLQARVRALSGQVGMAKVTLALTSRSEPAVATDIGFTSGLQGGWNAFTAAARVTAATLGALLPFLPLIAFAIWGAFRWRRRVSAA